MVTLCLKILQQTLRAKRDIFSVQSVLGVGGNGIIGIWHQYMGSEGVKMGRGSVRVNGVWVRMGRVNRVCGSECNVGFYGVWYEC